MAFPKSVGRTGGASDGEDAAVRRIAAALERASGLPPEGEIWIGDDAAVVAPPAGRLVLATDAVVEGVHADLALVGLDDLGWKALTACVSDLGAMGARPCHALVALCVPPGTDLDLLANGVAAASARWGCPVVGGDVTTAGQVMVTVAVTGALDGPLPALCRSGASPGDRLLVTGPLGASAAGLRVLRGRSEGGSGEASGKGSVGGSGGTDALVAAHRRPLARLPEGAVAREAGASAAMDVSDGLALDLHRLAEASRVGVRLDQVPAAPGATEAEALSGGEDYELVVATSDAGRLIAAFDSAGLPAPIDIGCCTGDPAERSLAGRELPRAGWEHRLG